MLFHSKGSSQRGQKVFVLGEQITARVIGAQLQDEGFEVGYDFERNQKNPLPQVVHQQSLACLADRFKDFARFSGPGGIIHPGVTLWAERPELHTLVQDLNLTIIGPSPRILSLFGNKLNFLFEAEQCGVAHLVLSFDPIHTAREIDALLSKTRNGFPFVLKAIKGGGSFGLFDLHDEDALRVKLSFWLDQLRRKQGEVILFAERYLEGARQITVPFVRFQEGHIQIFPTMDISLQCNHRKLIQFCPASQLSAEALEQIECWTKKLAHHWSYVGLGVFDFLVDGSKIVLINGLPRLDSSFHLWDQVAGTQAVSWQIAALENYSFQSSSCLNARVTQQEGMSVRIYAENPFLHLPQPGEILKIDIQEGTDVQLNYQVGDSIAIRDSGLVATAQVIASSRKDVLSGMQTLLDSIFIAGSLQTNERFLSELIRHPWIQEGVFHAGFIDEEFTIRIDPPEDLFKVCVALLTSLTPEPLDNLFWLVENRKIAVAQSEFKLHWKEQVIMEQGFSGVVQWDQSEFRVFGYRFLKQQSQEHLENRWLIRIGQWFFNVCLLERGKGKQSVLTALASGRVHARLYQVHTFIPAHHSICILESLGILVSHSLSYVAEIIEWCVEAEDEVKMGQPLAKIQIHETLKKDIHV